MLSFLEQLRTFVNDSEVIADTLSRPGGLARLIADYLVQFMHNPAMAWVVTLLVFAAIAASTACLLRRRTGSWLLAPLSLFPIAALYYLQLNMNYLYAGTVAMLLMLMLLNIQVVIDNKYGRWIYSLLSTVLLFVLAGSISTLYVVLVLVIEASRSIKRLHTYLVLPLLLFVMAWLYLRCGLAGTWQHLLLPHGYFTWRLQPGSVVYMPWVLMGIVCMIGELSGCLKLKKNWMKSLLVALQLAGWGVFVWFSHPQYVDKHNEAFKQMSHSLYNGQWQEVIAQYQTLPAGNLIYQNCLNTALAEEGRLADCLFLQPCFGIQSIYIQGNKTPYISALLSDIYFSMGHIAFSQRYAFEANESLGNYSPRLLKRLVQTNLIYGEYGVAKKYLTLLGKTRYYKQWAKEHERFLWNDQAVESDSLLGMKRRCLFPDNRMSGSKGLDDDLKQIIRQNPSHSATIQYLGSLYLLSKDLTRFMEVMQEFYATEALPAKLPVAFQEAVLMAAEADESLIAHYGIDESNVKRYADFKQNPTKYPRTFWYYLKYAK